MSRISRIKEKLSILSPHYIRIIDESKEHANHFHTHHADDTETHLKVEIGSNLLANESMIGKHKAIYKLLNEEFSNGLHALSIKWINL